MKILVIDDEASQRNILSDILSDAGYQVLTAPDGEAGLNIIYRDSNCLVLTDLKMPGLDGLAVLKAARAFNPDLQVILMTAFGTIPSAVSAIKFGAYDYLTKPFQKEDLLRVVRHAVDKAKLLNENRALRGQVIKKYCYQNLIGKSKAMQKIFQLIDRVRDIDATVLITGESGTGKELVAKAIHYSGRRKNGRFVALNCGAIPENLIESELFGHEKGAFTGAVRTFQGKFEQANYGTIFLDEIAAMPLHLQPQLLRVLQENNIERVGGQKSIDLDVRTIAATNEDLNLRIKNNQFRMDLFHRLNVIAIDLLPLRERKEDIPLLTKHFLEKIAKKYNMKTPKMSPEAFRRLEKYSYPGNIRELENIIEKTIIMHEGDLITPEMLLISGPSEIMASESSDEATLPDKEKKMIINALRNSGGSIKESAELLGITYKTLQYRLKKFRLDKNDFKK